jgi:hypothetical protein
MAQKTAMHQMLDELMAHEYNIPLELIVKCKELIELENEQMGGAFISGGYAGLHFPLTKDAFYKEYLDNKFSEYNKTTYNNGL